MNDKASSPKISSKFSPMLATNVRLDRCFRVRLALPQAMREDAVVARALRWLVRHQQQQPSLASLASALGENPFALQKRFSRWAGISPKVFLTLLNGGLARSLLQGGSNILDTAYSVGLSSPSRLHDLFLRIESMTPGEYKLRGAGLEICYASHPTPFGLGYFAASRRGLCALGFQGARFPDANSAKQDFEKRWPGAKISEDSTVTAPYARAIFPPLSIGAEGSLASSKQAALSLHLIATPFRLHVWQALLRTPPGAVTNYASLAEDSRYARAVGQAVAANPISFLIPCHRVIRQSGALGNYYWGVDKKLAMLGCEAQQTTNLTNE